MKRIISLVLSLILVFSTMIIAPVSAAEVDSYAETSAPYWYDLSY